MRVLSCHNVNDAYAAGVTLLASHHTVRDTRNGRALVCPDEVSTVLQAPTERVLFDARRDANPFFHLFEALWMLAGRNDVQIPAYFVPRMTEYSDDGQTFHGAYGYRWRRWFGYDQLATVLQELSTNPGSRRAVVAMWDAHEDLHAAAHSKDVPCNLLIKFAVVDDALRMLVFNRSNDILWGLYGANAVHFSLLQEYLAARLAVPVGRYTHVSADFHAYETPWTTHVGTTMPSEFAPDAYGLGQAFVQPLVTAPAAWDTECRAAVEDLAHIPNRVQMRRYENHFFPRVAVPMATAYALYRDKNVESALYRLELAMSDYGTIDWLVAGHRWLERRTRRSAE